LARLIAPPALKHKPFRSYLAGAFVSNVGNSIQAWAIAWQVFAITGSSLMVGLLGIARVVPLLLFSLFGGVLADRADRRKVMMFTQSAMAIVSLILLVWTLRGMSSVAPLYALVAINAIARSFDGPARQALQVGLVPREDYPNAASINGVTWRLSDVLGPILTGALIAIPEHGLTLCYAFNLVSFLALLIVIIRLPSVQPPDLGDHPKNIREVLALVKEGLQFVNRTPVVRSAMWIDFWATLLSGAEALLPAFAAVVLGLGPEGYGYLAASTGFGALIAALGLSLRPTVIRQGRTVILMIGAFGLFTIGFGLSTNLLTACLCLMGVGAADMISTVMRQTIRQLATPDELRGRMTATSSLFHISGPQLGDFEAGAVAHWWGERVSIVLGGGLCLFVAAHWSRAKALAEYTHSPELVRPSESAPG
jgi:MFS family permease